MIGVGHFESNQEIERHVLWALRSGRVSYGPMCIELESKWARMHSCDYGVAMNSGTDALRIAFEALKITRGWPPGSKVIVPAVTFVATYNTVLQAGLVPVLVDVNKDCLLDIDETISALDGDVVCVAPVHLFGNMVHMGELARRLPPGIAIVEDACESAFAKDEDGASPGFYGDIACFSLYAAHHVVAGVGGISTTNDAQLADVMRSLVNHGRDTAYISMDDLGPENIRARFRFNHIGYSSRMMELQAALALPQLDTAEQAVARRRKIASMYDLWLPKWVRTIDACAGSSWMMYPIFTQRKWGLMQHLENCGVETRETLPLTNQPCYRDHFNPDDYPVAKQINATGLYIPCHDGLEDEQVMYIIACVQEFFSEG